MSKFLGLGTDIIEIARFQKSIKRSPRMLERLFTEKELAYCQSKGKNQILHLAGRFTAKEAIAKALGNGFGKKISFLDLEILNDKTGKPTVCFSKKLKNNFPKAKILVSISHSKTVATATALALKN